MNGGGNGVNYLGSLMVNSVKLNGGFAFHYDETLAKTGVTTYVISSWNEL
jgi:hypothetical protein